jgi:excisionase family DNA binding protein
MAVALVREDPIRPSEQEAQAVRTIDAALSSRVAARGARLMASTGEQFDLPAALYQTLRLAAHLLAQGRAVSIIPYNQMLTTNQAAELLNVSRPYLVRLLEAGEIPFQRVGTHRRIRFEDLMRYRAKRDADRQQKLSEITRFSQEVGLYTKP